MGIYAEVNIFGDSILDNQGNSKDKSQNRDKNSKKIVNVESKNGSNSMKRKLDDNLVKESDKKPKIDEISSKTEAQIQKSIFKIPKLSDKSKASDSKKPELKEVKNSKKPELKGEKVKERSSSKRDEKSQIVEKPKVCESKYQNKYQVTKVRDVSEKSKDQKKESSSKSREEDKKSSSSSKSKDRNENVSQRVEKSEKEKSLKPKEDLKKSNAPSKSKDRHGNSQKSEKPREKPEKETKIVRPKEDVSTKRSTDHSKKSTESSKKNESSKLKERSDNENQKSHKPREDSEKLKKIVHEKPKNDKDSEKSKKPESSKNLKDSKTPEALSTKKTEASKVVKSEQSSPKQKIVPPKTETPKQENKIMNKASQITPISGGKLSNFWKMYESVNHEEEFSSSESEISEEESEDEIEPEVQAPKERLVLRINTSALKVDQKLEEKIIENPQPNVMSMEIEEGVQHSTEIASKVEEQPMEVEELVYPSTQSTEITIQVEDHPILSSIPQIQVFEHPTQKPEVAQANLAENLEENFSNPKPAKKRVEHRQSFNGKSTDYSKLNGSTTKVQNQEVAQKKAEPIQNATSRHSLGESNEVRKRIQKAAEEANVQLFGLPRQFDVNDLNDQWSLDLEERLRKLPNILDLSRKSDSFLQLPHNITVSPQHDIPQQFVNSREGYHVSKPIKSQPAKKQEIVELKPNPVDFIPKPVDFIPKPVESIPNPVSKPEVVKINQQSNNMQTNVNEPLTAGIQNQPRLVNKVRPVIRPIKQIQPVARPVKQIQPVARPANQVQPVIRPVNQVQPVIRPAIQIQPFVRPGQQLKPYIRPVQSQKRPLPQSKRPEHPVQATKRPALQVESESKPVYQIPIPTKPVDQIQPPASAVSEVQPPLDEKTLELQQKREKMMKVFKDDSKKKKEPVKKNSNQKRLLNIGKIKTSMRKESLAKLAQKQQEEKKKPNKTEEVLAKVDTLLSSPDMLKLAEAVPEDLEKVQMPEIPISLNDLEVSDDSDSDDSDSDDSDDSESSTSSSEEEIDNFASQIENLVWGN